MRSVLILAAVSVLTLPALSVAAAPPPLSYEAMFAEDVNGRSAGLIAWSPDGQILTYVYDDGHGAVLRAFDATTGQTQELLRAEGLAKAAGHAGESVEIDGYQWSPRGDGLLLESGGDLYLLSLPGHEVRRLTDTAAAEKDPQFSPDGTRIAFARGADLHLLDLSSGREQALTTDGKENEILNGVPDWLYFEEIWHRSPTAFWWSPDGKRIAYERFDEREVPAHPLVDESVRIPKVNWQKYPKPGDPNPKVRVGVLELATGKTTWMETGGQDREYLARVAWTPDGAALAVQAMPRSQARLDLLRCTAADGRCGTLVTESSQTWVSVADDLRFLPGGRFLWSSERSGWRQLYLYEADGKLVRQVSPDGWVVSSVERVPEADEKDPWVLLTGYQKDGPAAVLGAIDRQVVRVSLLDSRFQVLTTDPGSHAALMAQRTKHWVHTWSTADTPERSEVWLAGRAGGPPRVLTLPSAPPSKYNPAALPRSEFLTIPGPDGTALPARLIKPAGFDPKRRYPVIMFQYGGPSSQTVINRWDKGRRTLFHKRMAQLGFAVLTVDGRNTDFFGKEGEGLDFRHMGEANLAAQLAGVAYLKAQPWADTKNIGLWGWSGGGFTTLYCLLHRPGVWKSGVAGAPVTDWRLYDSVYTERFLRTPQENEAGYRDSSPLYAAEHLQDHLLIVHGLADDNVHPQNSIQMIDRLVHAGRPVEEAFYPGEKHGMRPPSIRHFFERMEEYWTRTLQAIEVGNVEVR